MKSKQIYGLLFVYLMSFITVGCSKTSVPNEEAKKIFDEWNFIFSSGGFSGGGNSETYTQGDWVSFDKNGILTVHKVNGETTKTKYKIKMRKSIINHEMRPTIVYKERLAESFEVIGDTLNTFQEAYDGFSYMFVRR